MASRTFSEVPVISMEGQVEAAEYFRIPGTGTLRVGPRRAASEAVGRQDRAQEEGEAGVVVVVEDTGTKPSLIRRAPAEVADPFLLPRPLMT